MTSIYFNPAVPSTAVPVPRAGGAEAPEALAMRYLSTASAGWGGTPESRCGTGSQYDKALTTGSPAPAPSTFAPAPSTFAPPPSVGSAFNPNPEGVDILVIDQFKFTPEQTAAGALYTHGQEVSYVADNAKTSPDVEVTTLQAEPIEQFANQLSDIADSPSPPEVINLSVGLDPGSVFIYDFEYFDNRFKTNHGADPQQWDDETWAKYKSDVAIVGEAAVKYFEDQQARFIGLLTTAVEKLIARGVTVVVAGGNQGKIKELFDSLELPVPDRMFDGVFLPSLPEGVLFAGASDSNTAGAKPADFTSPRNGIDVAADGTDIQVSARGDTNRGTSFAAPQIAALAADLKAQDPTLTPAQIEDIITQTAISIPGETARLGSGVIDREKALALADSTVTEITVFDTVQANFDDWDTAAYGSADDNLINMDDVRAMAADPYASSTDRKVAQYLIDHPEIFDSWERTVTGGSDGLLGKTDLVLWDIQKAGGDDAFDSTVWMQEAFEQFDTARPESIDDGLVTRDDILAIIASPTATYEMKLAARYIFNRPIFYELDSALNGRFDGKVSYMDISQWQLKYNNAGAI